MTKSACLPVSNDPISAPLPKLYAALIVAALIASAGVIPIWVEASERTNGMDGVGDVPGLKSLASTTARPAAIMARAGGKHFDPKVYADAGNRTGCTLPRTKALIPASSIRSR